MSDEANFSLDVSYKYINNVKEICYFEYFLFILKTMAVEQSYNVRMGCTVLKRKNKCVPILSNFSVYLKLNLLQTD